MNILPEGPPGIGQIIGEGLADIANQWAGHRTTTKALMGLGFSNAEAKAYSHLGPQFQQQAIQAKQQQQIRAASATEIERLLGGQAPSSQSYQQPEIQGQSAQPQTQKLQARQLPHEQQQAAIQQATSIAQNPNFRKLNDQQQSAQALQNQQLSRQLGPQAKQPTAEQQAILQSQAPKEKEASFKDKLEDISRRKRAIAASGLPNADRIEAHKLLQDQEKSIRDEIKENKREAREDRKEAFEERKLSAAEQRQVDKETLPVFKDINDKAKAAKDSDLRLNRMERLLDKGRVQDNVFIRTLSDLKGNKYFGDIAAAIGTAISNRDTQEFDKLSTDFIKDAKQFFGSRITDNEVKLFLKTVPALSQTNEGKRRVIRNLRIFNEAAELKQDAMNTIIRENNGKRPVNLEELIDNKIGSQLDALSKEFTGGETIDINSIVPSAL
jgi:hypothetical protein